MSSNSLTANDPSFTLFPTLPTELRLKIWSHVYEQTPPQLIPFYLCKSDLDYLRLRRKACQNYPHIFAGRMKHVPPILHACQESRSIGLPNYSLGFDISRILSMGKADVDVEMYTTCSHEVAMEEEQRACVYWDKNKDVIFLDTVGWMENAAYVWGGKTGIRFGKIKRVAMDFDTLTAGGIGEYLGFEGVDEMLVLRPENTPWEVLDDPVHGILDWGNRRVGKEGWVKIYLASRGLVSCEGGPVGVKFDFEDAREVVEYVAGGGREPSVLPQDVDEGNV